MNFATSRVRAKHAVGFGLMSFEPDEHQPILGFPISMAREYSEATAARIDQEVQQRLEERHQAVHQLLTHAREKLDRLVNVLLQEETAAQQRLAEILGPRPECTPLKMNNGTMESTPPSPLERS